MKLASIKSLEDLVFPDEACFIRALFTVVLPAIQNSIEVALFLHPKPWYQ